TLDYISRLRPEPIVLKCEAPWKECPLLVRFSDVRSPTTVEALDPHHLEMAFGPGYSLRRIVFELTSDEPKFTISARLPWLGEYPEPRLNQNRDPLETSLSGSLTHGAFVRR